MFRERDCKGDEQGEFWVRRCELPKAAAGTFYRKLDETLEIIGFATGVREICRAAYADASVGGRPGIDPAVYFKMLMIGFFENLPSERSIASRCADSLSLRAFLGYDVTEDTPDHSSLSVIRNRLGVESYHAALELVLSGLYEHGLLKETIVSHGCPNFGPKNPARIGIVGAGRACGKSILQGFDSPSRWANNPPKFPKIPRNTLDRPGLRDFGSHA